MKATQNIRNASLDMSRVPINKQIYQYYKPDNNDAFVLTEGIELKKKEDELGHQLLRGPIFETNPMHGILSKMQGKLTSKNYDTYYLNKQVQNVHKPVQKKFNRFHDAKVKYGGGRS